MDREPSAVYRATDPERMREVLDEYEERYEARESATKEYAEELGGELHWYQNGWSMTHIVLVDVDEVPDGWHRYKTKNNEIRPHAGGHTKAAKEARERVAAIRAICPSTLRSFLCERLDIPKEIWGGRFGARWLDGDYWLLASSPLWYDEHGRPREEGNEHFERADLSDYYRAKAAELEAEDAE